MSPAWDLAYIREEVRLTIEMTWTDRRGELGDVQYRETQRYDTRWWDQMSDADIGSLVRAHVEKLKEFRT